MITPERQHRHCVRYDRPTGAYRRPREASFESESDRLATGRDSETAKKKKLQCVSVQMRLQQDAPLPNSTASARGKPRGHHVLPALLPACLPASHRVTACAHPSLIIHSSFAMPSSLGQVSGHRAAACSLGHQALDLGSPLSAFTIIFSLKLSGGMLEGRALITHTHSRARQAPWPRLGAVWGQTLRMQPRLCPRATIGDRVCPCR